jgi:hypothetical protein
MLTTIITKEDPMQTLHGGLRTTTIALLLVLLAGCAATTRFESPAAGSRLALHGHANDTLPRSERLSSKATGQHEFKATAAGGDVMYGILPLRVNGGKMAGSILFFAPALFIGGFRDVFPYYEIDPAARVIRYKSKANEEWRIYTPTTAEMERAQQSFEKRGS